MLDGMSVRSDEGHDTQLRTIRDLMLSAARRGAWLTLGEIARLTEIGEASISAQLRHLRKWRHGRHRVEKRQRLPRPIAPGFTRGERAAGKRRIAAAPTMWEYRVLPPAEWEMFARPHEQEAEAQQLPGGAVEAGGLPGFVQSCETEEACRDANSRSETNGCGDAVSSVQVCSGLQVQPAPVRTRER